MPGKTHSARGRVGVGKGIETSLIPAQKTYFTFQQFQLYFKHTLTSGIECVLLTQPWIGDSLILNNFSKAEQCLVPACSI